MWLPELLLASGEWDWSAMELRAEGEVCGVEWMFGDRGSVGGCGGYSCLGNLRQGGSACILRCGEQERMLQGGTARTTNNRMEVTAAIEGLRAPTRPAKSRSSPMQATSAVG